MTNVFKKTRNNLLSAYEISKNKKAEPRITELNALASMVLAMAEKKHKERAKA